jgi:rhodanese-related sulfurtransferase
MNTDNTISIQTDRRAAATADSPARDAMVGPQSTLAEVLDHYPGAQRALFQRYHVGGCSSCGFNPAETLADLCQRKQLEVAEVLEHIQNSHEADRRLLISPAELDRRRALAEPLRVVDIRSDEEWDAARIEGAVRLSSASLPQILAEWPRPELVVIYDHRGEQSLDAAAFLIGHGFEQVRCLEGGIDAWSRLLDPQVPRYRLETA